ncbi:MAG: DUF1501 domain-containing protein, partial [Planctomycetaceae bacterium]|nr:DUF1501 domain-containing protein [Planctomycetaceae bacterium]
MQHNRRQFLKGTGLSWLGLPVIGSSFYSNVFGKETTPKVTTKSLPTRFGKAKSVIQLWMWGGPCHLETFDPKPGAGKDYCGSWDKPAATNVPGFEISQSLPMLAQCADLYSVIRSMTHGTNHHEVASYMMQTGRMP